jgi:hypothetical protein
LVRLFSVRSALAALTVAALSMAVIAFTRLPEASAVNGNPIRASLGVGCSVRTTGGTSVIKLKFAIKASTSVGVIEDVDLVITPDPPPAGQEVDDQPNTATYTRNYEVEVTPGTYQITLDVDSGSYTKHITASAEVGPGRCRVRTPA